VNNVMGEEDLHPQGLHTSRPGTRIGSMMAPSLLALPDGRGGGPGRRGGGPRSRTPYIPPATAGSLTANAVAPEAGRVEELNSAGALERSRYIDLSR